MPESLELAAGDVVLVPLGGREVAGVVWEETARAGESVPAKRLKSVIERFPVPPLPAVERRFLEWLASYSLVPLGTALRLALRVGDALLEPLPQRAVRRSECALSATLRMTPARRRVLDEAAEGPARPRSE
ncbi:MAG: primosomal protein N', partial [Geminicoccales bacterium]